MRSAHTRGLLTGLLLVVACSTGAIVATYSRLSHTWDEGTHVIAGVELLQDGRYTFQTENPPLSRVVVAIVPYLSGTRMPPATQGPWQAAEAAFYRSPNYLRNLTEARIANLVVFWACVAMTWILAGGRSDPWVAFLASSFVATLPPVVAHSGFATTDVPFLAAFLLSLLALRRLVTDRSFISQCVAGVAIGIAVATKFSTIVFLPPVITAVVLIRRSTVRVSWSGVLSGARLVLIIGVAAALTIWAAYGFHVGRLSDLPQSFPPYGSMPTTGLVARISTWRLPGHEFLHGLLFLNAHTVAGHRATLFDEFSQRGFWLFYPVVLATKTPLPFLLFMAAGLSVLLTASRSEASKWFAGLALGAAGVLACAMASPINLGVRHVLVIYPLVALAAAFGVVRYAEQSQRWRLVIGSAAACLIAQLAMLLASAPHQITYYNWLAGSDPAHVSSDSDFDWGQHAIAMEQYFADHPVPELYVLLNGSAKTCSLRLPPLKGLPNHPVSGWIAISDRQFRLNRGSASEDPCTPPRFGTTFDAPPGWLDWLKRFQPVAVIGKTVRLYHIPEAAIATP